MEVAFALPELGENIEGANVVRVLVREGDIVQSGQDVVELETEKASIQLPSPHTGRVARVPIKEGDHLRIGDSVLVIETEAVPEAPPPTNGKRRPEARPEAPEEIARQEVPRAEAPTPRRVVAPQEAPPVGAPWPPQPEAQPRIAAPPREEPSEPPSGIPMMETAAPSTRRLARELGADLSHVRGTGPSGRITQEDVKAHVRRLVTGREVPGRAPSLPDFSKWGEVERRPMNGVRRKTAEVMDLSWHTIPHVTHFDLADITALEDARRHHEPNHRGADHEKVTVTALVIKACAAVLKDYPQVNASMDFEAEELILKRYIHVGVAVDTEHGLVAPVIRNADQKSAREIARELNDLAARARERRLDVSEMRGATFTVTNLGGIGGVAFTPIVNFPQAAILGVSRTRTELSLHDGEIRPRTMLPLSLSYDHRIIDGALAARFTRQVAALLADPFALFLEA
ncbi:MAG: 2-oxo acid dehydrogenase subunit E2 [Deltaproteobacteria bacterium]|nr:2-oxo acid dehydrogenase subunit E2 [Deltaproteobacteria bacterium]